MTPNSIAAILAALPPNQQEAARVLVDRLIAEVEWLHQTVDMLCTQHDAALRGWRDAEMARAVAMENCTQLADALTVTDHKYRALLRVCVKQDREREAEEARLWRDEEPLGKNELPADGLAALLREGHP